MLITSLLSQHSLPGLLKSTINSMGEVHKSLSSGSKLCFGSVMIPHINVVTSF